MPDDCDRLNCCPEESLGYEVPKENPNPPGIPTYTLTVDDEIDGGRVEPGTSEYSQNTFATIKAIPDQGYKFKRWDGDVEGSENPASVYMDRNKSVSAVFEPIIHLVTAKTNPVGAGTVNGAGLKAWGSTVEIETVPNAGYAFSHYSGDLNTTNNPADLYVDGDKEIVANLDQITYNLNILTNPEGAGLPLGAGDYPEGTTANISSNPSEGFCFAYWTGDVSSPDDPKSIVMDGNKSVTANYSQKLSFLHVFEDDASKIFEIPVNALSPMIFTWELGNPVDSTTQLIIQDQDGNVLYFSDYVSTIFRTGDIDTGYTITHLTVTVNVYGHATNPEERFFRINSSCIP